MAGLSRDIFDLIHSLSPSELTYLVDEGWKSKHSPNKGEVVPIYVELISYFRKQDDYNDKVAKKHFGYTEKPNDQWRAIKRETIKKIEECILNSKGKKNSKAELYKYVSLVREYTERGIWKRADHLVRKAIEAAIKYQEHKILVDLLDLQQIIVVSSYSNSKEIFPSIQNQRIAANKHLLEEESMQVLAFSAHHEAKAGRAADEEKLMEILKNPLLANDQFGGYKAEMLYWMIKRRCFFLLKKTQNYLDTLEGGKTLFLQNEQFWYEHNFWNAGVAFLCEYSTVATLQHRFDDSKAAISTLESLKEKQKLSPISYTNLEGRILLTRTVLSRKQLVKVEMKQLSSHLHSWLMKNSSKVSEDLAIRLVRMGAVNAFVIEDYSLCVKLIYRFRTKQRSSFRPNITSFFWVFLLVVRIHQSELSILKRELTDCRKYLEEHHPDNELYSLIYQLAMAVVTCKGEKARKETIQINLKTLILLLKSNRYSEYENFFPFAMWSQSWISETNLISLLRKTKSPMSKLYN